MNTLRNLSFWPWLALASVCAAGLFLGVCKLGDHKLLLDTRLTRQAAEEALNCMDMEQLTIHFQMTAAIDSVFPIAYGMLLAIWGAKSGRSAWVLAFPAIAVVCDYAENASQLLALSGHASWLWLKSIATPLKFIAIGVSSLSSIAQWLCSR